MTNSLELSRNEELLNEVIVECMTRIDLGDTVDPAEFYRRYPQIADELRQYFSAVRQVEQFAGPPTDLRNDQSSPSSELTPASKADTKTVIDGDSAPASGRKKRVPKQLGHFRIMKRIGAGGMGDVYLAHDERIDRQVALKIPRITGPQKEEILERFQREASTAGNLRHPHICPVFEYGKIKGRPYLAMAYIEGRSLSEIVREEGPLAPAAAAVLVQKLALALQAAHDGGVMHRDLKPSNVMMAVDGEPVIMDFGLARRLTNDSEEVRLTQSGALVGTPAYMSPEQVRGETENIGPATDVYALGVILYELLTGDIPFGGDLAAVLAQVQRDRPHRPSKLVPGIAPSLEALCMQLLEKDADKRPQSMADVADRLEDIIAGNSSTPTISLVPPHAINAVAQFYRKHRITLTGVAASLLGITALAAIVFQLTNNGQLVIRVADKSARVSVNILHDGRKVDEVEITRGKGETTLRVGHYEIELDGEFQGFHIDGERIEVSRGKPVERWLRPDALKPPGKTAALPAVPLRIHTWELKPQVPSTAATVVRMSPDGKSIAYATGSGDLRVVAPHTLQATAVATVGTERVGHLAWHPSSQWLVTATKSGAVQLWSLAGQPSQFLIKQTAAPNFLEWSADGSRLLIGGDGRGWLWHVSEEGGELSFSKPQQFVIDPQGVRDSSWSPRPETRQFVTTGADRTAYLWSANARRLRKVMQLENPQILRLTGVAWHPQDRWIAFGVASKENPEFGEIRFFGPDGRKGPVVTAHQSPIIGLAWSPDGQFLASVDASRKLILSRVDGEQVGEFFPDTVGTLQWSPDGHRIVVRRPDGGVSLLSVQSNSSGERDVIDGLALEQPLATTPAVALPNGDYAWLIDGGRVQIVSAHSEGIDARQIRVSETAKAVTWSNDGSWLAVRHTGDEYQVQLFRADGTRGPELAGHKAPVGRIPWHTDNRRLATVGRDGHVKLWDTAGQLIRTFPINEGGSAHVFSWHPAGDRFIVASNIAGKDTLQIWRLEAERPTVVQTLPPHVYDLSWTPTGEQFIACGPYGYAQLWSADGTPNLKLSGYQMRVRRVKWNSVRTHWMAWDETSARVWQLPDKMSATLPLDGKVTHATWSPRQDTIAFGQLDGGVRLWTPATDKVQRLAGHASRVVGLSWSASGRELITTCADRTCKVWDATTGKLKYTFLDCRDGRFRALDPTGKVIYGDADVVNAEFQVLVNGKEMIRFDAFQKATTTNQEP